MGKSEFKKRHDIVNVSKSIIQLYESLVSQINENELESLPLEDIKPSENCETIVVTDNGNTVKEVLPPVNDNEINLQVKDIFTDFYNKNAWGDKESKSGTGSNLEQTSQLMNELPEFFKKYKIKSMLDIPCGDFYWMQRIDLSGIKYIGADIVDEIINNCSQQYPFDFKMMDIINSDLPKVDLILCRDCLVHLPYSEIQKALNNIKKSGSKYLLTTSFPKHDNVDIPIGHWRPLNLQANPFDFGEPIFVINENCTENDGVYNDKSMCLWLIKDINI